MHVDSSKPRVGIKFGVILISGIILISVFSQATPASAKDQNNNPVSNNSVPLPYPLYDASAVFTGNEVYLFGGFTPGYILDTILCYYPGNHTVVTLPARLPHPVQATDAFWDGKSAYIIGGIDYNGTALPNLVVFTPPDKVDYYPKFFPYGIKGNAIVWTGKAAYMFGNCLCTSKVGRRNTLLFNPADVSKANATSKNVTVINNTFPYDIAGQSGVWTGSEVYLFGGNAKKGNGAGPTDAIMKFDPRTNAVTVMHSKLPSPRYATGAVIYGEKAYVFGGFKNKGNVTDELLVYDPKKDELAPSGISLPYPLATRSYVLLADGILLCGGQKQKGLMSTLEFVSLRDVAGETPDNYLPSIVALLICTAAAAILIIEVTVQVRRRGKK